MTTRVLSIDGGGIRGLIPAMVLRRLEQRTGRPVADHFDIIVGTSTGGILACGLSVPDQHGQPKYDADSVIGIYRNEGPRIFSRTFWHRLKSAFNLVGPKYPIDGMRNVLRDYIGDTPLSEALTCVVTPCYELTHRKPTLFRRSKAKQKDTADPPLWKVAVATSVAPTYFPPFEMSRIDGGTGSFTDGGIYAGHPAMIGASEALDQGADRDDMLVVSLGTGDGEASIPHSEAKNWGIAQWARPLIGSALDGSADIVHHHAQNLFGDDYFRFQVEFDGANPAMDDASEQNLERLSQRAHDLLTNQSNKIDRLAERLSG